MMYLLEQQQHCSTTMCAFLPLGFLLMSMDIVHDLAWCLFPSPKTREFLINYYTRILTPRVQPLPWPGYVFPIFAVYVFVGLCPNWDNLYTFLLYLPLSYRYWRILTDRNGENLLQSWWIVILLRILLAIVTWRNFTSTPSSSNTTNGHQRPPQSKPSTSLPSSNPCATLSEQTTATASVKPSSVKMAMKEEPEFTLDGGRNNSNNTDRFFSAEEPEFTRDGERNNNDHDETTMGSVMRPTDPQLAPTYNDTSGEVMTTTTGGMDESSPTSTRPPVVATTQAAEAAMMRMTAPLSSPTTTTAEDDRQLRSHFGPAGRWAHSTPGYGLLNVCGCISTFFSSLFWVGFVATPCLLGQLMQRLGLSVTGMPTFDRQTGRRTASPGVCTTILLLTTLVYICLLLFNGWLVDVVGYIFLLYCIFMGILLRSVLRQHFGIGPMSRWLTWGDGMVEDCCLAVCCSCCSAIQMARHTHDETQYPYTAGNQDGLPSYAPDMWSVPSLLDTTTSDTNSNAGEAELTTSPYRSNPSYRNTTGTTSSPSNNASTPMANVEIV